MITICVPGDGGERVVMMFVMMMMCEISGVTVVSSLMNKRTLYIPRFSQVGIFLWWR